MYCTIEKVNCVLNKMRDTFRMACGPRRRGYWLRKNGINNPDWIYSLSADDVPVGRSNLRHYLNAALEQDGGHIGLSIASQYRGRGYSKILLRETLKRAKEKGINPVLVFHFSDNVPACKMSESVGGKLVEERFHEKHGRLIRKYSFNTDNM